MKAVVLVVVVMLALLLLAACGSEEPADEATDSAAPVSPESISFEWSFPMQSADPAVFFQDLGLTVMNACYDIPITTDQSGELKPMLAESWSQSEDGMTVTLKLREDVKFQDGTPLNAEAVKFSVERTIAVGAGVSSYFVSLDNIETPDEYTVVFNLNQPNGTFLLSMAGPWTLRVVSPTAVKEHATEDDPWAEKWLGENSAGSGPYKLTKYSSTEYELEAVDGYWGEPAAIKTIRIKVVPNFTSQILNLQSGQTDLMVTGVPLKTLPSLLEKGFELHQMVNPDRTQVFLNERTPAFATAEGRTAIAAAIDRDAIVNSVYGEYGTVAEHIWTTEGLPGDAGRYQVEYDPERAKAFVETLPEADRSLTFQYVNDTPEQQTCALQIGAALDAVGLKVEVVAVTQPETFGYPTADPSTLPDMLMVDFTGGSTSSHYNYPRVFLAAVDPDRAHGGLSYLQPTQMKEADDLAYEANFTPDKEQADALYAQAAEMHAQSGLWIPIVDRPQLLVARAGLTGFDKQKLAPNCFQPNLVK